MTDAIYLLQPNNALKRIERQDYATEALLQELIENYPELLAGDQFNEDEPLRWLLITREAAVPDEAANRWSLDHLLLDQSGVPTFVEVKRSSDTRIRREVVGQMLDYAANALKYWPKGEIKDLLEKRCGSVEAAEQEVLHLLGPDTLDPVEYWQRVESNLLDGKVRLLFVGDELPAELRSIIEFLNGHMQDVEVLGVELRQYMTDGMQAIVPKLVGKTEQIRQRKSGARSRKTTEEEFLQAMPENVRGFFQEMLDIGRDSGAEVYWGTKGFSLRIYRVDRMISFGYGFPPGVYRADAELSFYLKFFNDEESAEIKSKLSAVAPFEESGMYTFNLPVNTNTLDGAMKTLPVIREIIQQFGERATV